MSEIPLIVVAGPTASGKTELAIEIAEHTDGEIVNADSMQIYKYMDIGTAKPTREERARAVHHLIDFLEPSADFSVADYTALAHEVIADIASRGKTPIMCGGTGLYISSVVNDVSFGDAQTNHELRERLTREAEEKGGEYMLRILSEFDEESAKRLHPNNLRRIIRAIEFYETTGKAISEHQAETKQKKSRYDPLILCIAWDRQILYDRINRRVDIMLEAGLEDEVRGLLKMGCRRGMNSMQGIGYKEMLDFISGAVTLGEAAEAIKQNSRRYAKRQITWFRRDERARYLKPPAVKDEALKLAFEHLKGFKT